MSSWEFACPDWWDRLQQGELPIADLPIDERVGDVAAEWFDHLKLPDVIGQPSMREAADPRVRQLVRAVFGSLVDGHRMIGEVFELVPKKNAKTTNGAAIGIVFMLMNQRHHADMLIIGPTQKISEVAFEQAAGMIEADKFLKDRFHVQHHKKTIFDRTNNSRLMVRTFGMDVLTGSKPVFVLIDEVHILGSVPYAADVIRQIRGGMMPFPEALLVMITTQSDHAPAGVFKSELAYSRGVRDGRITEGVRTLPVLFEFPESVQKSKDQRWRDPKMWHLVTPNLGRSITIERLVQGLQRAEEDGKGEVIAWATQHLNVEVGMALHSRRWVGADIWPARAKPGLTLDAIIERSEVAVLGIDGGGLDDLLAASVIGRCRETKRWLHWAHAWAQPKVLEIRKEIAPRLLDLERSGELTICEDPTQDIDEVATLAERLHLAELLPAQQGIGLDPFGVGALIDAMVAAGIAEQMMMGVPQGVRLSPAVWGLERKLNDGTFEHGDQALMNFAIGNAVAEQRGNAVIITKETAGKAKIDPLIATFNAVQLMSRNPQAARAAAYVFGGF